MKLSLVFNLSIKLRSVDRFEYIDRLIRNLWNTNCYEGYNIVVNVEKLEIKVYYMQRGGEIYGGRRK